MALKAVDPHPHASDADITANVDAAHAAFSVARANAVKTPAELAQLLVNDPQNIEAYVAAAHKAQGNGFVQAALAIAQGDDPAAASHAPAPAADDATTSDHEQDAKIAALSTKWGTRPRHYAGLVDGNNAAELIFRDTAPKAVAFINARAKELGHHFELTVAELTTNFIAEGGFNVLDNDTIDGIDGFDKLGLDTFGDRLDTLRPWLHPAIAEGKLTRTEHTNEKHEKVHSISNLSLIQAIYAQAAMMASVRVSLERDARGTATPLAKMSDTEAFYLQTRYFNQGEAGGAKELREQGTHDAHRAWKGDDSFDKHKTEPAFNGAWRTASYELMATSTLDHDGGFRPVQRTMLAEGNADLGAHIAACEQEIAAADVQLAYARTQLAGTGTEPAAKTEAAQLLADATRRRAALVEELAEMTSQYDPAMQRPADPTP